MIDKKYVGSSFDDFLKEEDIEAEVSANAAKRVLAWQLMELMKQEKMTKTSMAARMNTSRAALNRLLDPDNTSVSLHTMEKAAATLGKKLEIHLV